jgi:UDP-N-acetylmuramoyl-L-alanyl-D-glutamate--2,6-diaminopimelate ligase
MTYNNPMEQAMITLQPMMSALSLSENARQLLNPVMNQPFGQFVVDSRQVGQGDVFVLLKSQNATDSLDLEKVAGYLAQVA